MPSSSSSAPSETAEEMANREATPRSAGSRHLSNEQTVSDVAGLIAALDDNGVDRILLESATYTLVRAATDRVSILVLVLIFQTSLCTRRFRLAGKQGSSFVDDARIAMNFPKCNLLSNSELRLWI